MLWLSLGAARVVTRVTATSTRHCALSRYQSWKDRHHSRGCEGEEGLGGGFVLPPCCKAWLRTYSRCFVSSCAIGVHIFQLFFQTSSDLSLKAHTRVVLRAEMCCPAKQTRASSLTLPKQACLAQTAPVLQRGQSWCHFSSPQTSLLLFWGKSWHDTYSGYCREAQVLPLLQLSSNPCA